MNERIKRRLKKIAPLRAGKMLGALYASMGLIFVPFFVIAAVAGAFAPQSQQAQGAPAPALIMGIVSIFMPVIYGIMGFVGGGIICAAIYNLFAGWIGGIEVEVE